MMRTVSSLFELVILIFPSKPWKIKTFELNLLILDDHAKHGYLTWRVGIFHDFSAAKKESYDFFQASSHYVALPQQNAEELILNLG
mgnify:CR=1 FL=1